MSSDPAREGGINLLRGAVACGNSASSSTDGAKADPATSKPATASSAVTRIAADVHPAELSGKVTAANDPNYLLGRPSQYTSKVTFTDTRIKPSDVSVAEKGPSNAGERSKCSPTRRTRRPCRVHPERHQVDVGASNAQDLRIGLGDGTRRAYLPG
ncbi:UNVERIFIED_CONTAM: hypothetical protein RKD50_009483 [Streptomyces canus]